MQPIVKNTFSFITLALLLTACQRDLSSDVYTSDSTLSLTMEGKIVSVRPVTVKDHDQLGDNTTGVLAGGAMGAAAGNAAGSGTGRVAATVGGAVAGAVVGAVAQGALGTSEGYEYIVKVDASKLKDNYYEGSGAMRSAISTATTNGLITIVQGRETLLEKGQPVYVIFSEKRARIIPVE